MELVEYGFHDLCISKILDQNENITEGFEFGSFNSTENSLWLVTRDAPTPDEFEVLETVPGMQGSYDFSDLGTGERFFQNREVSYQCLFISQEYIDRKTIEHELKRKLMPLGIQNLYDSHMPVHHWQGKCKSVSVDDDAKYGKLTVTVTFSCYPFAISNYPEGDDLWDDAYFPDWTFSEQKYSVNGFKIINVLNPGSKSVQANLKMSGTVRIEGDVVAGQATLKRGLNSFQISGNGTIEFIFYREEMF